jgi:hypothetical protein
MKSLSEFTTRKKIADFAGMIAFDKDDEEILLWKKHKGVKVDKIWKQNQVISVGFKMLIPLYYSLT